MVMHLLLGSWTVPTHKVAVEYVYPYNWYINNSDEVALWMRRKETSAACCPSLLEAMFSTCSVLALQGFEKRVFISEFSWESLSKSFLIRHFSAAKTKIHHFYFKAYLKYGCTWFIALPLSRLHSLWFNGLCCLWFNGQYQFFCHLQDSYVWSG